MPSTCTIVGMISRASYWEKTTSVCIEPTCLATMRAFYISFVLILVPQQNVCMGLLLYLAAIAHIKEESRPPESKKHNG